MSNAFFFEPNFSYQPVIPQLDKAAVEKDIATIRQKIVDVIRQQVTQKDLSRSEVVFATRMSPSSVGMIVNGKIDKVSTDRLLRVARRLGLKPQIKFSAER